MIWIAVLLSSITGICIHDIREICVEYFNVLNESKLNGLKYSIFQMNVLKINIFSLEDLFKIFLFFFYIFVMLLGDL